MTAVSETEDFEVISEPIDTDLSDDTTDTEALTDSVDTTEETDTSSTETDTEETDTQKETVQVVFTPRWGIYSGDANVKNGGTLTIY